LNKPNDCSKEELPSETKTIENNCNDNSNIINNSSSSSSSNNNNNSSSRSDAEEFVTASDCTGTPPSRSSSYHTPSDGEATSNSPWWELDTIIDADTTMDSSKCLQLTDESQQVFICFYRATICGQCVPRAYLDLLLGRGGGDSIFFLIRAQNLQVKFLVIFESGESLILVVFFFFNPNRIHLESTYV
jgi:hypothetical protein